MSDSKTGVFKPILNKSKDLAGHLAGFMAGHLAFNNAVPTSFRTGVQGTIAAAVILVAGLFVATKVKNQHLQNGLIGLSTYAGIKTLNSLTTIAPAVNGLGFALPQGAVDFLHKVVPNLGEVGAVYSPSWDNMTIHDPYTNFGAVVDQTYEIVGATNVRGLAAYEPDLGISNYSIKLAA